jgi:hypothetical protein
MLFFLKKNILVPQTYFKKKKFNKPGYGPNQPNNLILFE